MASSCRTSAIFCCDRTDLDHLFVSKHAGNEAKVSKEALLAKCSRRKLERHVRRTTRGTEETYQRLNDVLTHYKGKHGCDIIGCPLLDRAKMDSI